MPMIDQFGPVLATFLLLGGALWFLRRRGWASFNGSLRTRSRRIEVLERCPLTAQHSVHLVRVGGRTMLIGVAPQNCQVLVEQVEEKQP